MERRGRRVDGKQLDQLLLAEKLTATERQALAGARAIVRKREEERDELKELERAKQKKGEDIERLRKHLAALTGQSAATPRDNPFVQRLVKAEDEVERLQARSEQLEKSREGSTDWLRAALKLFERNN